MSIESREAAAALNDIEHIVRRVRQSTFYNLASLMLILWGALVFTGYIVSFLWPRAAGYAWPAVHLTGIAGSFAISAFGYPRTGIRAFGFRALAAFLVFVAFGIFASVWLGHLTARQLGAFWAIYFMAAYTTAGLWVGHAFVAIGLSIITLTLIGYFFVGGWFDLWMAFVNGGGLILGGLWMRRS